jgi:hypothetical protein
MLLVKAGSKLRQDILAGCCAAGNPEMARDLLLQRVHYLLYFNGLVDKSTRPGQQQVPGLGQFECTSRASKQVDTEIRLKGLDVVTDRWLRKVKMLCGLVKIQALGSVYEGFESRKVDHGSNSLEVPLLVLPGSDVALFRCGNLQSNPMWQGSVCY